MELEKARLEAMPKIVGEMVKPAEKIKSINVNHVTGVGQRFGPRRSKRACAGRHRDGIDHGYGRANAAGKKRSVIKWVFRSMTP